MDSDSLSNDVTDFVNDFTGGDKNKVKEGAVGMSGIAEKYDKTAGLFVYF